MLSNLSKGTCSRFGEESQIQVRLTLNYTAYICVWFGVQVKDEFRMGAALGHHGELTKSPNVNPSQDMTGSEKTR